jgi:hypothetical protein
VSTAVVIIVAVIVICLCALVAYVGSLARSAYALRIELHKELQNGIAQLRSEVESITRGYRIELGAEIDRSRAGLQADAQSRFDRFAADVTKRLSAADEQLAADRSQFAKALTAIRNKLTAHDDLLAKAKTRADAAKPAAEDAAANAAAAEAKRAAMPYIPPVY